RHQSSKAAADLDRPRGQSRSTSTRKPPPMLGGSYTRATSTFVIDMNTIVLLAVGRPFSQQRAEHVRQKRIGNPATRSASYPTSALAQIG
ncbi:MAG TPA: hypothetical protein VHZ96_10755, partial [Frankiaceae bacterium]|nr:hypothetical protein [Frankiaceae bacterium]